MFDQIIDFPIIIPHDTVTKLTDYYYLLYKYLMQHDGLHFGQGTNQLLPFVHNAPDETQQQHQHHQQQQQQQSGAAGSTTTSLRQFRKKDTIEKPIGAPLTGDQQSAPSGVESGSQVARVAPHNRYPSRHGEYYHRYAQYPTDYPLSFKDPPAQVKYSEISDPPHDIDQPPSDPTLKHQQHHDMDYPTPQQAHMKQYQPPPPPPAYDPQQFMHKQAQLRYKAPDYAASKDHLCHQQWGGKYPQQGAPRGNDFLAELHRIHPAMARSIMADHHLRGEGPVSGYEQRGAYGGTTGAGQGQRYYQPTVTVQPTSTTYAPSYNPHRAQLPTQSPYGYAPAPYKPPAPRYPPAGAHMDYATTRHPPTTGYPPHEALMSGYPPGHPQKNAPYGAYGSAGLEYAQHYQHRRGAATGMAHQVQVQDYYQHQHQQPSPYRPPHHPYNLPPQHPHHQAPPPDAHPSVDQTRSHEALKVSSSIKQYIENWAEEEGPSDMPPVYKGRDDSEPVYVMELPGCLEGGIPFVMEGGQYILKGGTVENSGMIRIIEGSKEQAEPNNNNNVVNLHIVEGNGPDCLLANRHPGPHGTVDGYQGKEQRGPIIHSNIQIRSPHDGAQLIISQVGNISEDRSHNDSLHNHSQNVDLSQNVQSCQNIEPNRNYKELSSCCVGTGTGTVNSTGVSVNVNQISNHSNEPSNNPVKSDETGGKDNEANIMHIERFIKTMEYDLQSVIGKDLTNENDLFPGNGLTDDSDKPTDLSTDSGRDVKNEEHNETLDRPNDDLDPAAQDDLEMKSEIDIKLETRSTVTEKLDDDQDLNDNETETNPEPDAESPVKINEAETIRNDPNNETEEEEEEKEEETLLLADDTILSNETLKKRRRIFSVDDIINKIGSKSRSVSAPQRLVKGHKIDEILDLHPSEDDYQADETSRNIKSGNDLGIKTAETKIKKTKIIKKKKTRRICFDFTTKYSQRIIKTVRRKVPLSLNETSKINNRSDLAKTDEASEIGPSFDQSSNRLEETRSEVAEKCDIKEECEEIKHEKEDIKKEIDRIIIEERGENASSKSVVPDPDEEITRKLKEITLNREEIALHPEEVALNPEEITLNQEEIVLNPEEIVLNQEKIALNPEEALNQEEIVPVREEILKKSSRIEEKETVNCDQESLKEELVETPREDREPDEKYKDQDGIIKEIEELSINSLENSLKETNKKELMNEDTKKYLKIEGKEELKNEEEDNVEQLVQEVETDNYLYPDCKVKKHDSGSEAGEEELRRKNDSDMIRPNYLIVKENDSKKEEDKLETDLLSNCCKGVKNESEKEDNNEVELVRDEKSNNSACLVEEYNQNEVREEEELRSRCEEKEESKSKEDTNHSNCLSENPKNNDEELNTSNNNDEEKEEEELIHEKDEEKRITSNNNEEEKEMSRHDKEVLRKDADKEEEIKSDYEEEYEEQEEAESKSKSDPDTWNKTDEKMKDEEEDSIDEEDLQKIDFLSEKNYEDSSSSDVLNLEVNISSALDEDSKESPELAVREETVVDSNRDLDPTEEIQFTEEQPAPTEEATEKRDEDERDEKEQTAEIIESEIEYRSVVKIEENNVLLEIGGEIVEITVNNLRGQKIISVLPLFSSTYVNYMTGDNVDLNDNYCNEMGCETVIESNRDVPLNEVILDGNDQSNSDEIKFDDGVESEVKSVLCTKAAKKLYADPETAGKHKPPPALRTYSRVNQRSRKLPDKPIKEIEIVENGDEIGIDLPDPKPPKPPKPKRPGPASRTRAENPKRSKRISEKKTTAKGSSREALKKLMEIRKRRKNNGAGVTTAVPTESSGSSLIQDLTQKVESSREVDEKKGNKSVSFSSDVYYNHDNKVDVNLDVALTRDTRDEPDENQSDSKRKLTLEEYLKKRQLSTENSDESKVSSSTDVCEVKQSDETVTGNPEPDLSRPEPRAPPEPETRSLDVRTRENNWESSPKSVPPIESTTESAIDLKQSKCIIDLEDFGNRPRKDDSLQVYKDEIDSKLSSLNLKIPIKPKPSGCVARFPSQMQLSEYELKSSNVLMRRFLNREKLNPEEIAKVRKIISYKRLIEMLKSRERAAAAAAEEAAEDERPRKRRKRFRNLYTAEEEETEEEEEGGEVRVFTDYSVIQKDSSGVPKLVIKRTLSSSMQPVVVLERSPELDSLAKTIPG